MPMPAELCYEDVQDDTEGWTLYDDQYLEHLQVSEHLETKALGRHRANLKDAKGMELAELQYRNEIKDSLMYLRWVRDQLARLKRV